MTGRGKPIRSMAAITAVALGLAAMPDTSDGKSHQRGATPGRQAAKQYLAPPPAKAMPPRASLNANTAVSEARTRRNRRVPKPQPIKGVDFNDSPSPPDTMAMTGAGRVRVPIPARQPREIRRKRFTGVKGRRLSYQSYDSTGSVQSVTVRRSVELTRIQRDVARPDSGKVINKRYALEGSKYPGDAP